MLESLTSNVTLWIAGGATGIVLWVLNKVPNESICNTKRFWNKTIEPWFIDLIDNIVGGALRGFVRGLRVDDK